MRVQGDPHLVLLSEARRSQGKPRAVFIPLTWSIAKGYHNAPCLLQPASENSWILQEASCSRITAMPTITKSIGLITQRVLMHNTTLTVLATSHIIITTKVSPNQTVEKQSHWGKSHTAVKWRHQVWNPDLSRPRSGYSAPEDLRVESKQASFSR